MRFQLAPNSSTLDDLERPKRPARRNRQKLRHYQKNFNEDRLMLSAAKCRPMDLFSRNTKYMRMFVGVPSEWDVM